ncbi:MAG: two-component system NarL family sensor kinase [Polaribacter sp.]
MKKSVRVIICTCYVIVSVFNLNAVNSYGCVSEEASCIEASSYFTVISDSIFKKKYNHLKNLYQKENFVDALNQTLLLQDLEKGELDDTQLFLIKTLLGEIYNKSNNHKRALHNYKVALFLLNKRKLDNAGIGVENTVDFAEIYLNLATSFYRDSNKDSATYYLEKTEALSDINPEIRVQKAKAYSNLSGIFQLDSLFDKALIYAKKAIVIHRETNNKISEAAATSNLGSIYLSQEQFLLAKQTYFRGIELLKNKKSRGAIRVKADLYYNLAWAMRNLKEFEAYDFQELSYEIEDEIRDKEYRKMIAIVAAENDIKVVKKEEENKRLRQSNTFWAFIIVGIIIIISLLYWLTLYQLKQKNLGLKMTQTQLIQSQRLEKLKSESQKRVLNATIDGKESERKDIAETLHDSVSALLSSANLHLIAIKSQFKGKIPIEIDKTQSIIAEASIKIRDLSHTLVSSVLLKFGLNYALKDMASKYSNSALEIDIDAYDLRRYDQNFEIKIYNIIQELVNNVLKHSKAKNTFMKLYEKDAKICFQISDDGVGFDKTKLAYKDGLGLNQIEARIQMMTGVFIIESVIGEGTFVSVKLPIIEKVPANPVSPIL